MKRRKACKIGKLRADELVKRNEKTVSIPYDAPKCQFCGKNITQYEAYTYYFGQIIHVHPCFYRAERAFKLHNVKPPWR